MVSDRGAAEELLLRKLALLSRVLDVTRHELLLVDLDGLPPLIERKEALIAELTELDQALEALGDAVRAPELARTHGAELQRLVEAILENEQTMETRMGNERERLRQQLRDLDHQAQVRGYLERQRSKPGKVNLTR